MRSQHSDHCAIKQEYSSRSDDGGRGAPADAAARRAIVLVRRVGRARVRAGILRLPGGPGMATGNGAAARRAGCQRNLMQIGVALLLYDRAAGQVPTVPPLGVDAGPGTGPLRALLELLGLADLKGIDDETRPPARLAGFDPPEQPVPGFL